MYRSGSVDSAEDLWETWLSSRKPTKVLEARIGVEPTNKGFADLCLTTWLPRPTEREDFYFRDSVPRPRKSNRYCFVALLGAALGPRLGRSPGPRRPPKEGPVRPG